MEKTFETADYVTAKVRTVMIDLDGSTLEVGIEITGEDFESIELLGSNLIHPSLKACW